MGVEKFIPRDGGDADSMGGLLINVTLGIGNNLTAEKPILGNTFVFTTPG
jgi:hypothetical protein